MAEDPPEREVKDFQFKQMRKLRLFPTTSELPVEKTRLLAVSNKFGLLFLASDNNVKAVNVSVIEQIDSQGEKNETAENVPVTIGLVGSEVTCLSLSADDLTLAVAFKRNDQIILGVFDVRAFAQQQQPAVMFAEMVILKDKDVQVLDVLWNPSFKPSCLAVCFSNGSLALWDLDDTTFQNIATLPAEHEKTSICWSPKGKQLVAGDRNGVLMQYDLTLQKKKEITSPSCLTEPHQVSDVLWISTLVFAAVFTNDNEDSLPQFLLISIPKNLPRNDAMFEDIYFSCEQLRENRFFMRHIEEWGMVISTSSNAFEVAALGRQAENQDVWEKLNFEDSSRAQMPLSENNTETYPMGMCLSLNSTSAVSSGEKTLPPAPILFLLSTDGVLCPFKLVNENPTTDHSLVKPAEILPSTGQRIRKPGTPLESPPQVQQVTKPVEPSRELQDTLKKTTTSSAPNISVSSPSVLSSRPFSQPSQLVGIKGHLPSYQPGFTLPTSKLPPAYTPSFSSPQVSSSFSSTVVPPSTASFTTTAAVSAFPSPVTAATFSSTGTTQAFQVKPTASSNTPAFFTSQPFQIKEIPSRAAAVNMAPSSAGQGFSGFSFSSASQAGFNRPLGPSLIQAQAAPVSSTSGFGIEASTQRLQGVVTRGKPSIPGFSTPSNGQPKTSSGFSFGLSPSVTSTPTSKPVPSQLTPGQPAEPPLNKAPLQATVNDSPVEAKVAQKTSKPTLKKDPLLVQTFYNEIEQFNQELAGLRRSVRKMQEGGALVGTKEEMRCLRSETDEMEREISRLNCVTKEHNKDVAELKNKLLETFEKAEDARVRSKRRVDPKYLHLLKSRPLDPDSARKMKEIRSLFMSVDSMLTEVNFSLDDQWDRQNRQQKKAMHIPTLDVVYNTLRNHHCIVQGQAQALDKITEQLRSRKILPSSWHQQTTTTAAKRNGELSSLADSLIDHSRTSSPPRSARIPAQVSPKKQAELRAMLNRRQHTPVRSTSQVVEFQMQKLQLNTLRKSSEFLDQGPGNISSLKRRSSYDLPASEVSSLYDDDDENYGDEQSELDPVISDPEQSDFQLDESDVAEIDMFKGFVLPAGGTNTFRSFGVPQQKIESRPTNQVLGGENARVSTLSHFEPIPSHPTPAAVAAMNRASSSENLPPQKKVDNSAGIQPKTVVVHKPSFMMSQQTVAPTAAQSLSSAHSIAAALMEKTKMDKQSTGIPQAPEPEFTFKSSGSTEASGAPPVVCVKPPIPKLQTSQATQLTAVTPHGVQPQIPGRIIIGHDNIINPSISADGNQGQQFSNPDQTSFTFSASSKKGLGFTVPHPPKPGSFDIHANIDTKPSKPGVVKPPLSGGMNTVSQGVQLNHQTSFDLLDKIPSDVPRKDEASVDSVSLPVKGNDVLVQKDAGGFSVIPTPLPPEVPDFGVSGFSSSQVPGKLPGVDSGFEQHGSAFTPSATTSEATVATDKPLPPGSFNTLPENSFLSNLLNTPATTNVSSASSEAVINPNSSSYSTVEPPCPPTSQPSLSVPAQSELHVSVAASSEMTPSVPFKKPAENEPSHHKTATPPPTPPSTLCVPAQPVSDAVTSSSEVKDSFTVSAVSSGVPASVPASSFSFLAESSTSIATQSESVPSSAPMGGLKPAESPFGARTISDSSLDAGENKTAGLLGMSNQTISGGTQEISSPISSTMGQPNNAFGLSTTVSSSVTKTTGAFGSTFGDPVTSVSQSSGAFGLEAATDAPSSPGTFGVTQSTGAFGVPSGPGVNTVASPFGSSFSNSSTGNAFGIQETQTSSGFGNPPAFAPSNQSGSAQVFGSQELSFKQSSAASNTGSGFGACFGLGGQPINDPNKNPFGGSSGSSSDLQFGGAQPAGSAFGQTAFGQSAFGTGGSSNAFSGQGGSVLSAGFGGSPFGLPQQSSVSAFGTPPSLGPSPSVFGSNQPVFNSSQPVFSSTQSAFGGAPAFGAAPAFGSAPTFGSGSAFGSAAAFSSPIGATMGSMPGSNANPSFGALAHSTGPSFGGLANQGGGATFGESSPFTSPQQPDKSANFSSWR